MRPIRTLAACAAALALGGCNWSNTDPLSIEVQFVGNHVRTAAGNCTVQFGVRAAGIGSLVWERVTISQNGTVSRDLRGAQTAEFWGAARLNAGEVQNSVPFEAPGTGVDTRIELTYRGAGSDARDAELRPNCTG